MREWLLVLFYYYIMWQFIINESVWRSLSHVLLEDAGIAMEIKRFHLIKTKSVMVVTQKSEIGTMWEMLDN